MLQKHNNESKHSALAELQLKPSYNFKNRDWIGMLTGWCRDSTDHIVCRRTKLDPTTHPPLPGPWSLLNQP